MNNKTIHTSLLTLVFILCPVLSEAQLSLNTENMALGGGGTAYLTGYESLFVNPANLYIQEKPYRFQASVLQGGLFNSSMLPAANSDFINQYQDVTTLFNSSKIPAPLTNASRALLLNRNYPNNRLNANNSSYSDFYWFGIKWIRPDKNYATSLRTRIGNRQEIARGFFSNEPLSNDGADIIDQSFRHQYQVLHEFSFGYAESFTFLNGLIPQISEFSIGIAPKIILAGAYLDVDHTNIFEQQENRSDWIQEHSTTQQTTGPLSVNASAFFDNMNADPISNDHAGFTDLLNPTGIGLGLDFGVTYLKTFGDDLSTLRNRNVSTEKSLRLSFSITDIGAIHYFDEPLTYETTPVVRERNSPDIISEYPYSGAPNEHYFFLNQHGSFIQSPRTARDSNSFTSILPTSIQTGALFQMNRLKVMGDFSLAFSDTAFRRSGLTSYFGAEIRPLFFLPLRAGTRIAPGQTGIYSFGSGIHTKYFDLNVAIQLKADNLITNTELAGASLVGLKIYL